MVKDFLSDTHILGHLDPDRAPRKKSHQIKRAFDLFTC